MHAGPHLALIVTAALITAACGKDDASCITDADCFKDEICAKPQKVCETPGPDMSSPDLGSDLGSDLGPDMAPDMAPDLDAGIDDMDEAPELSLPDLPSERPVQLAAGAAHVCVLFAGGDVRCWGRHQRGQHGTGQVDPDEVADATQAPHAQLSAPAVSISAGVEHTCALLLNGAVQCWGNGAQGQLGLGDPLNIGAAETPAGRGYVPLPEQPVVVGAGHNRSCAATGAKVSCWGDNAAGALGRASTAASLGAQPSPALSFIGTGAVRHDVIRLTMGPRHTCALIKSDRSGSESTARCWGTADQGRLGDDQTTPIGDDETLADSPLIRSGMLVDLAAGLDYTCAVTRTGGILCWGHNNVGQLGDDSTLPLKDREPVMLPQSRLARKIDAGNRFTCVLDDIGAVWCWGDGPTGQLGRPGLANAPRIRDLPGPVNLPRPAVQIELGEAFACALLDDDSISCWGTNLVGQLGVPGAGQSSATPTAPFKL